MSSSEGPALEWFTVLDWIGVIVASLTGVGLLLFPIAGQAFLEMARDFGSSADLPLLTRLVTFPWFPRLLALAVAGLIAVGLLPHRALAYRRAWVVGAFVLGGSGLILCWVGVYLPIYMLADAIKAE